MIRDLYSVRGLSRVLGVPRDRLEQLREHAVRSYRPFKRRTGSKVRTIDNPNAALKNVQRLIDRRLLKPFPLPDYLHGSVPGRSPRSNASEHLKHRCVVRIDIRDFFPSVSDRDVYRIWTDQFGFGPRVAGLLTSLTTYRGRLPQGAPTSSGLANLILLRADHEIQAEAESHGVSFTRFVDDLVFSGHDPRSLIQRAIAALQRSGFRVSHKKLTIMGPQELQTVTGLAVNSTDIPSVSSVEARQDSSGDPRPGPA